MSARRERVIAKTHIAAALAVVVATLIPITAYAAPASTATRSGHTPPQPTIRGVQIYSKGVGTIVATCEYRVVVGYRGRLPGGHVWVFYRQDGAAINSTYLPIARSPMKFSFLGGVPNAQGSYDFQLALEDSKGAQMGTAVTTSPFGAAGCPAKGKLIASYPIS